LLYDLSVVVYAFDMEVGDLRMMSETQDASLPGGTAYVSLLHALRMPHTVDTSNCG
jgi:hypothetical protein